MAQEARRQGHQGRGRRRGRVRQGGHGGRVGASFPCSFWSFSRVFFQIFVAIFFNFRVFSHSFFSSSKKKHQQQFSTGTFAGQAVAEGGVAPVGTPIAYIAETDADLEAAKAKAAGGGGAVAAAPAPVSFFLGFFSGFFFSFSY